MKLSIIIPAYNEEKRLGKSLGRIIDYCSKNLDGHEIIVVDDGSRDDTSKIALRHKVKLIRLKKNKGKGFAVKTGILAARYPAIMFMDADLSVPLNEISTLAKCLKKGYDIAVGSRKGRKGSPLHRKIISFSYSIIQKLILGIGIKDTMCGFKMFKAPAAKRIAMLQQMNRLSFDPEILFIAKKLGCKTKEAAVSWRYRKGSRVSPIKDSARVFMGLIKIRCNSLKGKYA